MKKENREYKLSFFNNDKEITLLSGGKKKFIIGVIVGIIALAVIFLFIFAITPIKKIMPGYPSETTRREQIKNALKIDSLDKEIKLWKQQLYNIQLITTGHEPIVIKSDSAYIEQFDIENASDWAESEAELRKEVESKNKDGK